MVIATTGVTGIGTMIASDHRDGYNQGGQYRIVRAEYGAGNRWVNVTQRLKEIASSNATFRIGEQHIQC